MTSAGAKSAVRSGSWVRRLDEQLAPGTEFLSDRPTRLATESLVGPGATRWGLVVAKAAAEHIADQLPSFATEAGALELLNRAVEATTFATLRLLATNDISELTPTSEPVDATRSYVRRGIPLAEVIRGIHLCQEVITASVLEAVGQLVEPEQVAAESRRCTDGLFKSFGLFAAQIADLYAVEQGQWVRSRAGTSSHLIDRLLDPATVAAPSTVVAALRFAVDGPSVAAVLWYDRPHPPLNSAELLERACQSLLANAGARSSLHRVAGPTTLHLWADTSDEAMTMAARSVLEGPVRVALGGPVRIGLQGFRDGYRAATAAESVMRLSRSGLGPVVDHRDVELVSFLSQDLPGLRGYVTRILGDLAGSSARYAQLRDTLWVYLECGRSTAIAARALNTHRNTVGYRVNQARTCLPKAISIGSLDVRVALEVVRTLGSDVVHTDA